MKPIPRIHTFLFSTISVSFQDCTFEKTYIETPSIYPVARTLWHVKIYKVHAICLFFHGGAKCVFATSTRNTAWWDLSSRRRVLGRGTERVVPPFPLRRFIMCRRINYYKLFGDLKGVSRAEWPVSTPKLAWTSRRSSNPCHNYCTAFAGRFRRPCKP